MNRSRDNSKVSPARTVAFEVLGGTRRTGQAYAKDLLESQFQKIQLSDPDRSLATELVYGVLRHLITLDHIVSCFSSRKLKRIEHSLLDALRLGLYQILFLEKIPASAAVDETVKLVRERIGERAVGFANGLLRSTLRDIGWKTSSAGDDRARMLPVGENREAVFTRPVFSEAVDDPICYLNLVLAHPRWMVERWMDRFGLEVTERICHSNNQRPPLHVRWRSSEPPPDGWRPIEGFPDMFLVDHGGAVSNLPGYADGSLVVQGSASARAVRMLDIQPGMRVLDVCAAPGTKTVHAADLAGDGGCVLAVDKSLWRMKKLKENLSRLRIMSVYGLVADAAYLGGWLKGDFERILVDVPCSNTAELARRVEVRHRLRPEEIDSLSRLQLALLSSAAELLSPGGYLAYCTCSLELEEGPEVIQGFIQNREGFILDKEQWMLPHENSGVGGYVARIMRC